MRLILILIVVKGIKVMLILIRILMIIGMEIMTVIIGKREKKVMPEIKELKIMIILTKD